MRKLYTVILKALIIPIISVQSPVAGQQEKSDTIKIRSTEVFVDAMVFDRRNRLIRDLSQQDFDVYEDGVGQEVTSFRVVRNAGKLTQKAEASSEKATEVAASES